MSALKDAGYSIEDDEVIENTYEEWLAPSGILRIPTLWSPYQKEE